MSGVDVGEASVPLATNEQLWDLLIGMQLGMRLAYPMSYVKTNECKADLTDDSDFFQQMQHVLGSLHALCPHKGATCKT